MKQKTAIWITVFSTLFALFSTASFAPGAPRQEATGAAAPAVTFTDLDVANCKVYRGATAAPVTEAELLEMMTCPTIGNRGWMAPKSDDAVTPAQWLVAFRKPVAVGTIEFSGSATSVKFLKAGVAMPADPASATAWQALDIPPHQSGGAVITLPVGTITQALLFAENAPKWGSRIMGLRVLKERFVNVTPMAVPFADSEYVAIFSGAAPTRYLANLITTGALPHWQNTGNDTKGHMHRPPVSDYAPSWFMLTWRQPQSISAVWLADNFEDFEIESYVGPASLNPRGTEMDWKAVRDARHVAGFGHMVEFPQAVITRGIRVNITKTIDGPIAKLFGLHALTDLKDQPVPAASLTDRSVAPPVSFTYGYDFDGLATMVINDANGHRVRNLFAREETGKGPHTVSWDLKDELGNLVPPGTYEWKSLAAPPLGLKYEMTCYPNVHENSPMNAPWLTGQSGPGGWMADHSSPRSAAASGDLVFLGAPVSESGVSFICCDLTGRKLWAIPSFGPWAGSYMLAADDKTVFNVCLNLPLADASGVETPTDRVWAIDIASHQFRELAQLKATSRRKRGDQWLAAFNNQMYLSVHAPTDWLASSASPADADIESCYPRYPVKRKERFANEDVPDPRKDFMGLFRLTYPLPPRSTTLQYIESMPGKSPRHHVVMAFNKPVAVGTVVLPKAMDPSVHVRLSVLKPDAPYPPNAGDPKQWQPFEKQPSANWDAAIAPKDCFTRALRVSFIRGDEDPLNEADDSAEYSNQPLEAKLELNAHPKDDDGGTDTNWVGQLEGLKIIGRRFDNVAPKATVRVSSGVINKAGEWDARRTAVLTDSDPGIYALEWKQPQALRGLAIKEIDGMRTEIDVYTGTSDGPVDIAGEKDWQHVQTYIQPRRTHWINRTNVDSRYLDGYIDFGKEISTRAVRFRVCEQWSDFPHEEALRWDLKDKLDPARCRIFGVAALKYVGGEAEALHDPLQYQRVEVFDGTSGKIVQEIPLNEAGPIATNKAGELFGISGGSIVKINQAGGPHHTIFSNDLINPQAMAIDKDGNFFVYDRAPDRKNIRVYSRDGKLLRTIGTPGGYVPGAWDPMRLNDISALTIDKNDQLWAVDTTFPYPKRIALFTLDGKFRKDFLGNTPYGGGGVLDRFDKRRLFFGPMEFELDWDTGHTRLKNLTWLGDTTPGEVPIQIGDRLYLVTRMGDGRNCDNVACVYRYVKDHSVLAAAMGKADYFSPLTHNGIQAALGVKSLRDTDFLWSDLNGDGQVQANEVTLLPRTTGNVYNGGIFTNFNDDLAVQQGTRRYEVKQYLPTGVPIYEVKNFPKLKGLTLFRMDDGNFHTMGNHSNEELMTPDGKPIWTYPAEGWTVEGTVEQKPYTPEQVVGQYYMAGHDTAKSGDLGEFFAFHTNMGSWNLWTADGMLAGTIFNDQRLPNLRQWSMPQHERGLRLDDVTIGQEHFSAWLCRTSDNHYYAVAGHNHISVVEILGLEKFKRQSGKIVVKPADVIATAEWDARQQKQQVYDRTPVVDCYRTTTPPTIDGALNDWEAETATATLGEVVHEQMHGAVLRSAWDDRNLYLCYEVSNLGPMKNSGEQWDRLFKTGGAVDLQIGLDPAADPNRRVPVAGDKRLLMTFTGPGKTPTAVLYEAVVPGTRVQDAWKAVSPVAQVSFDRVRKLDDVQMAMQGGDTRYVVEVAIPLADLGLKPAENLRLKLDWGVLVTDTAGNGVMRRLYWSNQATGIVADVPSEAKLQPDLWGYILFHDRGRRGVAEVPGELKLQPGGGEKGADAGTDKLLKDFERDLKDEQKGKK